MKIGCSNWSSMPMGDSGFRSIARTEPRLAPYVASPQPVWLWSADGSRILWSNDAGLAALGIGDTGALSKPRSPADPHGRQVARLARQADFGATPRLERLRGFGARLGQLMTCACSRFERANGEIAILLVAMDPFIRTAPAASAITPISSDNDRILSQPLIEELVAETASAERRMDELNEGPDMDLPADISLSGESRDAGPTEAAESADVAVADRTVEAETLDHDDAPSGGPAAPSDGARHDPMIAPLRFVWQTDRTGGFSLASEVFRRLAGDRTCSLQGRPWSELAAALGLDPHGRIEQAIAKGETFSGIAVQWPLQGSAPGRVELSGMPVFDNARDFAGYRGFGIYRPGALPADGPQAPQSESDSREPTTHRSQLPPPAAALPPPSDSPSHRETEIVEPPQNVVPFPLTGDTRMPSLSAVENHAFDEIARRLMLGLEHHNTQAEESAPAEPESAADRPEAPHEEAPTETSQAKQPPWLAPAAPPAQGESSRDRMLLDLVPSGILIYRFDRLLYANRAFLDRTGFASLQAMQEAGGLDALYVEPAESAASSASDEGMQLKVAPAAGHSPCAARLFSIAWDGEAAHALILQDTTISVPADPPQAAAAQLPVSDGAFEAILETAPDGIVLFDRSGEIVSCNRSAQALFGMKDHELRTLNFADLFAPESQRIVLDYFESLERPRGANPLDHGREVLGRERAGGLIPLSMTMGRSGGDGERYFAVFRDLSELRKNEAELLNARRSAERATAARADVLTSISHEIRGPLNTIIGFADVMIEERFGLLGNERYAEYLKDIRASAERAIAVLGDIVDISSIEAGNLNLKPVSQNLNEMVVQCVGVLQPQANRERVIIRTSLAHALPRVMADTQALRQITMNIVASSIRFSKAGGQVIVSTAASENGGAILRVRDTGRGLSEAELASALGSHRTTGADRGAIDLSLARALAEANRAKFQIKTTENSGTLIEVAFANQQALAG